MQCKYSGVKNDNVKKGKKWKELCIHIIYYAIISYDKVALFYRGKASILEQAVHQTAELLLLLEPIMFPMSSFQNLTIALFICN